jgi:hypothetical protein
VTLILSRDSVLVLGYSGSATWEDVQLNLRFKWSFGGACVRFGREGLNPKSLPASGKFH